MDDIDKVKYSVCCPLCENPKCVIGTDECEAEVWKRKKEKEGEQDSENNNKRKNEPMEASVALRVLADAVGQKWMRMLMNQCDGLGHIHDMWDEMYSDMDAIVCLEKYITKHEGNAGCNFGTPIGFEKYDEDLSTEEGEQE